jgi:hypothetical protein
MTLSICFESRFAECRIFYPYHGCVYLECRYANCHYSEFSSFGFCYAEFHYAISCYPECLGTVFSYKVLIQEVLFALMLRYAT